MDWTGQAFRLDASLHCQAAKASDINLINAGIVQILNTVPGERRMLPEFGSRIRSLVFDPHDANLYAEIGHEVTQALERWEPRVILVDVEVVPAENNDHALTVRVTYQLRVNQRVSGTLDVVVNG